MTKATPTRQYINMCEAPSTPHPPADERVGPPAPSSSLLIRTKNFQKKNPGLRFPLAGVLSSDLVLT